MSNFLLFFVCVSLTATAQNDRIYYDESWQQTKKRNADWYRVYTKEDSIYKIEDHYIDGPLYMTGYRTTIASNSCNYRVGAIIFYDHEGNKAREGQYKNGMRVGTWKFYYKGSGALKTENHYTDDTGEHLDYTLNFDSVTHQLKQKTVYLAAKTLYWDYTTTDSVYNETTDSVSDYTRTSVTHYKGHTYKDLSVARKESWKGKKPLSICYNEKDEVIPCDTIPKMFTYVEQMPAASFNMQSYLRHNLHYPKQAISTNIEGRTIIKFTIDEDGAISNPKIVKSIGGGCDEEALRLISEMPYWKPGMQNGNPVRVYFTLPLVFKLR